MMTRPELAAALERLYAAYNNAAYIGTDPVQYVHRYPDPADRELVGLLAANLAYGNVKAVHASIERVLDRLGPRPASTVVDASPRELRERMDGFVHRWTRGEAMAACLHAAGRMIRERGSLGAAYAQCLAKAGGEPRQALAAWSCLFRGDGAAVGKALIADAGKTSACKRLHLYLRWMVRKDAIDPGGWDGVSPSGLLLPVDVHMHRIGRWLGFTRRKTADAATVEEITRGFRKLRPDDPCRYDFALTRLGMAGVTTRSVFFQRLIRVIA